MKKDELLLRDILNFNKEQKHNVLLNTELIEKMKETIENYWQNYDKKNNSNCMQIIYELYLQKTKKSLKDISKSVGLHVRTLSRYRKNIVFIMNKFLAEYVDKQ